MMYTTFKLYKITQRIKNTQGITDMKYAPKNTLDKHDKKKTKMEILVQIICKITLLPFKQQ